MLKNTQQQKTDRMEKISFRELVDIPSTTHATFGLYKYPAKFIPHVVDYILTNYTDPQTTVFDPFGGYGTVGTVAKIHGNDYEMWDLNPMLKVLHQISIMKPVDIDISGIIRNMKNNTKKKFVPDWERHKNWFPQEFLPFLYRVWGYYHAMPDKKVKRTLTIPLLKVTRQFSYDDIRKQKLCRSRVSEERIRSLFTSDWKDRFLEMLYRDIARVQRGLTEYQKLHPKATKHTIKTEVDVVHEELAENKDILITSPPYLQSQEYMRQAKLDLFWLGFSETDVKRLSKLEIPYRNVDECVIHSHTYKECLSHIKEKHIRKTFQRYFWSILGTFGRLQDRINTRMFIFVGHSSTRGRAIPIDTILIEHLTGLGWVHEKTLSDRIVGRNMFSYSVNPASKIRDARTSIENLVILKKRA